MIKKIKLLVEKRFYNSWTRSERSVEVPFVIGNIDINKPCKVLVFGTFLDFTSLYLSALGFEVTGIDLEKQTLTHKNFKNISNDISEVSIHEVFDIIISISTIEHIGVGVYNESTKKSDFDVIQILRDLLSPNGKLLVTVPFGKYGSYPRKKPEYRKYDNDAISKLFRDFIIQSKYYKQSGDGWTPTTNPTEMESDDSDITNGVICISATRA